MAIRHIRSTDNDGIYKPLGINAQMALAAFDLFANINPFDPPFSVVLTD